MKDLTILVTDAACVRRLNHGKWRRGFTYLDAAARVVSKPIARGPQLCHLVSDHYKE